MMNISYAGKITSQPNYKKQSVAQTLNVCFSSKLEIVLISFYNQNGIMRKLHTQYILRKSTVIKYG